MGVNCCVPQCNSVNNKHKDLKFHKFPKDIPSRKKWKVAIKSGKKPSKYASICSKHFRDDDYTITSLGQWKILKKGAVPTLFLPKRIFDKSARKRQISRRLKNRQEESTEDKNEIKEDETIFEGIPDVGIEENIDVGETAVDNSETNVLLKAVGTQTLVSSVRSQLLSATFLTDNQLKHFTGYTRNEFTFLLNFFKCIPRSTNSALPMEDEMLLCLMMYRQKYYFSSLEVFFNVDRRVVQKIFTYWTNKLYRALKSIDFWKCRHKKLTDNYDVIVDCTEINIEKSSDPEIQQATYSQYKNTNTFKVLIGASEEGCIIFVSDVYGGCISDRKIVEESGILDILEEGMYVLADRGFDVSDLLEEKKVHLNIPPFKRGAPQLSEEDVAITKAIANRRILIEQLIGFVKKNKILVNRMPQHLWKEANEIIYNCFMLTNFKSSLVKDMPEKILKRNK